MVATLHAECDYTKALFWNSAVKGFQSIRPPIGHEAKAKAWRIDVNEKQVTAVSRFDCPAIESLAGFHDGRFLALATRRSKSTRSTGVYLFGADGKRLYDFPARNESAPGAIFSPIGVAFTSDGKIAVGDGTKKTVTIKRDPCVTRVQRSLLDPSSRVQRNIRTKGQFAFVSHPQGYIRRGLHQSRLFRWGGALTKKELQKLMTWPHGESGSVVLINQKTRQMFPVE